MTKKITLLIGIVLTLLEARAQNPGLLISEFLQNPSGTDSPFEYVEFLAVDNIDFSVTPYTVIVCNNGAATTDGWVEGLAITYAFEISSGSVSVGDVVYVGGTSMTPTGTQLRVINTGTTGGDGGIGNANTAGVIGNGGAASDGIAVFNLPVMSITSSTVPVDAVFFGSGPDHSTAVVSGGADGYELPVNDLYAGGKLQQTSFLAVDEDLTIASGVFDQLTNTFSVARTFGPGTATDGVSEITFAASTPPGLSFSSTHATYNETDGIISLNIAISSSNAAESIADIVVKSSSTASSPDDFSLLTSTITFPPSSSGMLSFDLQMNDDVLAEETEYIILTLDNLVNAEITGTTKMFVYISDDDRILPEATNELKLELLTSYSNGAEGTNSAEIVAYDSSNYRLYIANSINNQMDIVDLTNPAAPVSVMSIELDSVGAINSVAAYNGIVAVALQGIDPQQNGSIAFYDENGNWLKRLDAGAMPDMIMFTRDGMQVIAPCEGEPSADYLTDPEGTVAVIDMIYPVTTMTNANVTLINFNSLDGTETALRAEGIRIFGPGATASQDFEPEYVTVLEDGVTAFVTLQENNALAVIDLNTKTLIDVIALGTIDHNVMGYGMDVSNVTSAINIANFPVKGLFLPDAISSLNISGTDYLFTANEGDLRAYAGFNEETRIKDVVLDPVAFPDAAYIQDQYLLGRLIMTNTLGDDLSDGDFDELYSIGTRSFSIWDATTGALVFDSGDWIEQIIATHPDFQNLFNASNTAGGVSVKNRSDDKGPEVEGVTAATIEGNNFVFVSLERVGGVLVFNVNDPINPVFVGYENNRNALTNGPDRGAEGILYIESAASPNGSGLLLLANEISSTVTVFQINTCSELSGLALATEDDEVEFCANDSILMMAQATTSLTYQWIYNGNQIVGATLDSLYTNLAGEYQVEFLNTTESCSGTAGVIEVFTLPVPNPTITVLNAVLSTQSFTSYQWYYEGSEIVGETSQEHIPAMDGEYMVVVTNSEGCENSATYTVDFTQLNEFAQTEVMVYPNPVKTELTIFCPSADYTMVLSDMKGAIVFSQQITGYENGYTLNVENLDAGVYQLILETEVGLKTVRIVIEE